MCSGSIHREHGKMNDLEQAKADVERVDKFSDLHMYRGGSGA